MAGVNRLTGATSPYLRQHADNPVDWYPWGDEAFAAARERDVPILLSVGYSSCHWCHVMAHESFEDPAVAAVMNRLFVNVKVDREERPDVDAIYMQAVQAMTGQGGWPMTVFLAPDGRPFYGGTYFPKQPGHGRPGFVQLLEAVADTWANRRDDVLGQAGQLHDAIRSSLDLMGEVASPTAPTLALLDRAAAHVAEQFEPRFGGFGNAPKFPQAMTLDFVLRATTRRPDGATGGGAEDLLPIVRTSLDAMAAGGVHDQLGGGFHRYSVDAYWLVPHFEKMLYDQATLLTAYTHAAQVTGDERYRAVAEGIVGYVLRDLAHADGGFFSAEDADSEGVEGKFYCWSLDEIVEVCGPDAPEVIRYFGVTEAGNFEDPHTGFRGNILHAVDRDEPRPDAVAQCVPELLARRATRVRPGLDDKVLLAWNALFAGALAEAAAVFDRDDWLDAARRNLEFLRRELRRPDGRLLRSWQDGRADHLAYAEDYAALLEALLTLAEADRAVWLADARTVADDLLRLFEDPEHGGFFTNASDAGELIVRAKDFQDNASPSANSLAAHGLARLATATGDERYAAAARRVVEALADVAARHPTAFAYLLGAIDHLTVAPVEIAIVGDVADPATRDLRRERWQRYVPDSLTLVTSPGDDAGSPLLDGRVEPGALATAYVCEGYVCRLPVHDAGAFGAQLDAALGTRRSASLR
ncbi:MAG: thioredoxin domain-containing protein [Acidimicrobiia bacterium]